MLAFVFITLAAYIQPSLEHGYLNQPPGRSTAWRHGFDTPPNYQDNELNCGGFNHQWNVNGGKCGECGDPWEIPVGERPNQAGGIYATGTIVGQYQPGEVIDVGVTITANHKGWFEFRLCPVSDYTEPVTWQCLNETLLELEDGSTRVYIGDLAGEYWQRIRLPEITCSQCVLQWLWHCGNSYGFFPNGTECVGCGPQEQFYGCADISIGSGDGGASTTQGPIATDSTLQPDPTTTPAPEPTTTTAPEGSTTTTPPNDYDCVYIGDTADQEAMDDWCTANCNHIPCNCPIDCQCTPSRPC